MINTKSKRIGLVVLLTVVMLFTMAFPANHSFAADTQTLSFPAGETDISIDIVVNESQAYAAIEFGVSCSSGLTFKEFVTDDKLLSTSSPISTEKASVNYYGYLASDNIYKGKMTIGRLSFTYQGSGEETVTINELNIGRLDENDTVVKTTKGPLVYKITRVSASTPSGGGGSGVATITIGEEAAPLTTPELSDIVGHWAEKDILSALEKGFVTGYPDGTFRPNNPVTRGEFVTMLVKANSIQSGSKSLNFSDVANHWAVTSIMAAASNEYVNGYLDGTFRPNNNINRQEVAKIMAEFKALGETDVALPFHDVNSIGSWALPSVKGVYQAEIMKGDTNNNFAPLANTTRAEAVAIILRCMN